MGHFFYPGQALPVNWKELFTEHSAMLVGTVSPTQHFHTIGYGICSKEDKGAHTYVLQQIKDAVEAVVARRAAAKQCV